MKKALEELVKALEDLVEERVEDQQLPVGYLNYSVALTSQNKSVDPQVKKVVVAPKN
jgi:hypothetical protein